MVHYHTSRKYYRITSDRSNDVERSAYVFEYRSYELVHQGYLCFLLGPDLWAEKDNPREFIEYRSIPYAYAILRNRQKTTNWKRQFPPPPAMNSNPHLYMILDQSEVVIHIVLFQFYDSTTLETWKKKKMIQFEFQRPSLNSTLPLPASLPRILSIIPPAAASRGWYIHIFVHTPSFYLFISLKFSLNNVRRPPLFFFAAV